MELRHLKTFRTVAEKGGFSRAGEELGYAQSTVTAHIHKLEEELGSPLFDRLGKRTVLTDAGKHLLPYAKEMVRLSREAAEIIGHSEAPAGPLRIGGRNPSSSTGCHPFSMSSESGTPKSDWSCIPDSVGICEPG